MALIALSIPGTLNGAASSAGLTTLIASLLFLLPLAVWYRYSERIASDGGLYAFVEAAIGRRLARVQASFWITSYFLYLVYTVPYITYDLLPAVLPQISHGQLLLIDSLLVLVIVSVMLSPLTSTLALVAAIAGLQVAIAVAVGGLNLSHFGAPAESFIGHANLGSIVPSAATTSSLCICASLPLFLGGEVRGGTVAVRRALRWAFPFVASLAILAVFPLSRASGAVLDAPIPGVTVARTYAGQPFAVVVGLGVCVSVGGLILVEYLALSRLLGTIFRRSTRLMMVVISAPFVVASAVSAIDPVAAYRVLLKPSLIALWISQLMVVAAYPWFVRKYRKLTASDLGLAGASGLLMGYALYTAVATAAGT